jgi:hypothetical protein
MSHESLRGGSLCARLQAIGYGDMARGHRFGRDFSDGKFSASKLQQCDNSRHGLLTLLQCFSPAISDAQLNVEASRSIAVVGQRI